MMKHYRGYKKNIPVGKDFGANKKVAIRQAKLEGYDILLLVQPEFSGKDNRYVWERKK